MEGSTELKIIRLLRQPVELESVQEVNDSFDFIRAGLSRLSLRRWSLILDMRNARPSRDPEIENAFRENRKRIYRDFRRMAILLETPLGVMQVRRMLQSAPDPKIEVFDSEPAALDWVSPQM